MRRRLLAIGRAVLPALSLLGCGDDGTPGDITGPPPGPSSFVVSTALAGNGSGTIAPTNVTVTSGNTATFTIERAIGSTLGEISGCGGTLTGSTYVTAPVTGVCTVTATFALVTRDPLYGGTVWITPDLLTSQDPTIFDSLSYSGQAMRQVYDRRVGWTTINAFVFDAWYADGSAIEIVVNPEFGTPENAEVEADTYAPIVGRVPAALRANLVDVWIHRGDHAFGGGNYNFLIHTDAGANLIANGFIEEVLVHEGGHTSLDWQWDGGLVSEDDWVQAQDADGAFVSQYAQDFPMREDVAESFSVWLIVRFRPHILPAEEVAAIEAQIPNRIAYFDGLDLDLHPLSPSIP